VPTGARAATVPADPALDAGELDLELFDRLRALRKRLADERKVPAFVVFSDRSLQDMAQRKPTSRIAFLEVYGVGQKKLDDYGEAFLAEIQRSA
jgi:ATP-dependent DNA helicase RecQ